MRYLIFSFIALLPAVTFAQGLQQYIPSIVTFINRTFIPFLLGIAFLVFIINVVRYFIVDINVAGNKDKGVSGGKAKAKAYVIHSIFAFVLILVFFGIVNLLVSMSDFGNQATPTPDIPGFTL